MLTTRPGADRRVFSVFGPGFGGSGRLSAHERAMLEAAAPVARTEIPSTVFSSLVQVLQTAGHAAPGDGGGATYRRAASEPAHPGKVQSADGAWWELVPGPRGINVLALGADPTGASDSAAAFKAAIEFAGAATSAENAAIHVPAGEYLLQESGVFSHRPAGVSAWGITWHGDGWLTSRVLLDPPDAAQAWLYDSTGSGVYIGHVFNDLGFSASDNSGNRAYANGFLIEGTVGSGVGEGAFRFNNCMIGKDGGFRDWMNLTGGMNAAEIKHVACQFREGDGRVLYQDNAQSMNIAFVECDVVTHTGDVFEIRRGGVINVHGGALQWESGWLCNITNTTNELVFLLTVNSAKVEMRDSTARLVSKTTDADGTAEVFFNNVDMTRGDGGAGARQLVDIAERTTVKFRDCWVEGYTSPKAYKLRMLNPSAKSTSPPPTLVFEGCRVPASFPEAFDFADDYGTVSASGCYSNDGGALRENNALDFDLNWRSRSAWARLPRVKTAVLKDKLRPWPYGGGQEHTLLLPPDAVIVGARVYKPANGGSGATYQLAIGNDDKSATYATSTSGAQSGAHVIDWSPGPDGYVHVGTALNDRTVRLWDAESGNQFDADLAGEIAIVEYM